MDEHDERAAYVVPSYRAPDEAAWYHFLHGNVPGHQIDFIYRAEVPQGPLTRQHFSHLARLMKYIEPQSNERFAFAIGNLSRDDTQYEPGHGGLALIFGLRIHGATDHAGRQDPPFAHAVAAIDRALDYPTLIEAAVSFHRHVLGAAESAEWYRAYVLGAQEDPDAVRGVLERYVARFGDLPQPPESTMPCAWVTGGAPQPRRIVVAHDDDVTFGEVAAAAARIAAVLYRSDIRWTVISNGREDDVPNGVSIRLLARTELGPADAAAVVHAFADLPDEEAELAGLLFGATPVGAPEEKRTRGWRERYSEMDAPPVRARGRARDPGSGAADEEVSADIEVDVARGNGEPVARRSAPGAMREPAAPIAAPVRVVPPSVRPAPPSIPPADGGESREEDRAALVEMSIPPAPRVPVQVESTALPSVATSAPTAEVAPKAWPAPTVSATAPREPAAVAAPPRKLEPAPTRRKLWLIVIGLCVVVIALIVLLAIRGGTPEEPRDSTSKTTDAPSPGLPPPSTTTALPRSPVSETAQRPRDSSAVPSGTASAAPAGKRPPRTPLKPKSVFGDPGLP